MTSVPGYAPVQLARLLAADTADPPLLADDQYEALLALEHGSARLAAAAALEMIAASEALVAKKVRTQDLSTDGPAVAAELRQLAAAMRARARDAGEGETVTYGLTPVLTGRPGPPPHGPARPAWGL